MQPRNRYEIDLQPVVRLDKNVPLTNELIMELIINWGRHRARYKQLDYYYTGNHDILSRKYDDPSKPNNRLVNNFASYIVDIRTGYFTGLPMTVTGEDTKMMDAINEILEDNNNEDVIAEIDRMTNIKGHAFELLWIDEESNIRFKELPPDNVIMIYSSDIAQEPLYAIRYYDEVNPVNNMLLFKRVFVYDKDMVKEFEMTISGTTAIDGMTNSGITQASTPTLTGNEFVLIPTVETPHYFGRVPIIEYMNNALRIGSFDDVVTLIDAYNAATSDTINEIDYFADAYLKLKNMSATDTDDIAKMKENRVLLVEGDGDAEWLTKQINDTYLENIKERLTRDIHKFSKTPNLISEHFVSNLSGTAIRYKVWGLEQDTAKKERRWKRSLHEKMLMICNILNTKGNAFDANAIGFVFNRNLPQNVMELGQMVSQLKGTVSDETLLAQLPFVENPKEEMVKAMAEKEANMKLAQQYAPAPAPAFGGAAKPASTENKPANVKPDTHKNQ